MLVIVVDSSFSLFLRLSALRNVGSLRRSIRFFSIPLPSIMMRASKSSPPSRLFPRIFHNFNTNHDFSMDTSEVPPQVEYHYLMLCVFFVIYHRPRPLRSVRYNALYPVGNLSGVFGGLTLAVGSMRARITASVTVSPMASSCLIFAIIADISSGNSLFLRWSLYDRSHFPFDVMCDRDW